MLRTPGRVRCGFAALLVAPLVAFACANTVEENADANAESETPVVALVDGYAIRLATVDERIRDDLFDEAYGGKNRAHLHQARRETIETLVDERLVARVALADGMSPDAWLDAQRAQSDPVTDTEIAAFFEANRARIGEDVALEEVVDRIRFHLERVRDEEIVASLRAHSDLSIRLPHERVAVEAVGHTRGPEGAPITIIEFSDYECPYCGRAEPTVKLLMERHPEDIRLVYRHLPLDFHPNAMPAARAAICADAQGRFWEYHDQLFADQKALGADQLSAYAETLGLDVAAFTTCLESPGPDAHIARDVAAAQAAGATGTPAFFINGIFLSGAQPIENFEAIIAEELERTAP